LFGVLFVCITTTLGAKDGIL